MIPETGTRFFPIKRLLHRCDSEREAKSAVGQTDRVDRAPMQNIKPEIVDQTLALWQRRSGQTLVEEDARQMLGNICGFFGVLSEWIRPAQLGTNDTKQSNGLRKRNSTQ